MQTRFPPGRTTRTATGSVLTRTAVPVRGHALAGLRVIFVGNAAAGGSVGNAAAGGSVGNAATGGKKVLEWLQVSRGIAAVLVLLYHCAESVFEISGKWPVRGGLTRFGYCGVDFFFPVSGFIISYAHWRDLGDRTRLPRYLWRRFARLYPLFWIILLPKLVLAANRPTVLSAILDLLLLRRVTWTLTYEVMFYAFFSLCIVSSRTGLSLLAGWGAASFVSAVFFGPHDHTLAGFIFSRFTLEFLLGVLSARIVALGMAKDAKLFLYSGLSAFSALIWFDGRQTDTDSWRVAYACASFLILTGLALLETSPQRRVSPPRWLVFTGDCSYSVFLFQVPLLGLVQHIAPRLAFWPAPDAAFAILFVFCLASGMAAHLWIERPITQALNRWTPAACR